MTEELNSSDTGDKNWKEMREKLSLYESKIAEYEGKERQEVFNKAGLDTTKGVGKAVEMMYEGELTVEGIQQYASEEFQVEFGNQDRLQNTVEQSQERLNTIQNNSVVDTYNTDVISQVREIEKTGNIRNSIAAKLSVIEEAKKNSK
jgi:hypothetical protein|tara:strand:+ start:844 stop:1284 length:441 start_codon:yes stop_codon:yes gene_type:complete